MDGDRTAPEAERIPRPPRCPGGICAGRCEVVGEVRAVREAVPPWPSLTPAGTDCGDAERVVDAQQP